MIPGRIMGSVMQTTREAIIFIVALLGVMQHTITVIIPGKCQCLIMNVVVVPIQTVQFHLHYPSPWQMG